MRDFETRPVLGRDGTMRRRSGILFALAVAAALAASFTGVFDHALWFPDEPRVAEIGREMYVSGNLVVPKLLGKRFMEKPPLYWWGMSGMFHTFGVSDSAARATSALAAFLTLLLLFFAVRRLAGSLAALLGVMAAATITGFFENMHRVLTDPALALCVMLGYVGFVYAAFPRREEGRPHASWILLVYFAMGASFLAKGLVGPGLIAGPAVVYALFRRRWDLLRSWAHLPGIVLFLGLVALWPVLLHAKGGSSLLDAFLVNNQLDRIAPPGGRGGPGHAHPFWYYLAAFPEMTLPWILVFPSLLVWLKRGRFPKGWSAEGLAFLVWVFPIGLVLLSVPGTKRPLYLLPLLAPLGGAVGAWAVASARRLRASRWERVPPFLVLVVAAGAAAAALFGIVLPGVGARLLAKGRSGLPAADIPAATALITVAAAALVLVLLWVSVRWLKEKGGGGGIGAAAIVATFAITLCGGTVYFRLGDVGENTHSLITALAERDVAPSDLVGFRLDESGRSVIPFYTGVMIRNIRHRPDLAAWVEEHPSCRVLLRDDVVPHVPAEVRRRLVIAGKWSYGHRRVYCLLAPAR